MKHRKHRTPKRPYESTEDFKLRLRQLITGNRPHYLQCRGRLIDSMTEAEREALQLKGML